MKTKNLNFTIVPLCDCNLSDLRFTRLNGADFSRPTALNIASQTLQGIHDVQFNHYFHRDIRSGNFVVGLNDHHHIIYIINFSLSYEYYKRAFRIEKGKMPTACDTPRITPKLPWISCRFQSRAFHLGKEIHRLDDIESWLFLLIDTFDQKALPWKKAKCERIGYEQKERLFMGDYRESLGDLKPYIDIMMKYFEHCRARPGGTVDFPFYGNILEQMAQDWKITGKEPLDWMPDSSGYRN
uniref:Protein kinase domain-containing protein n=1 Tax=Panagrolaimus davidi TaxID=227884 RepID=A0A914PXK1_9BILA